MNRERDQAVIAVILAALERRGVLRRGSGTLPQDFLDRALTEARASVVEALVDERRSGR